jgi:Tol biopolymer transport system component
MILFAGLLFLITACTQNKSPNTLVTDSITQQISSSPIIGTINPWITKTISPSATNSTQSTVEPMITEFATPTSIPFSAFTPIISTQESSPLIAAVLMGEKGNTAIYTINSDGNGLTLVSSEKTGSYALDWSPDGQNLSYLSGNTVNEAKLTIVDYSNGLKRQVNFPGVTTYCWLPDSERIAFTTAPETQGGDYYIYIMKLSDFSLSPLYQMPENKRVIYLNCSPKEEKILAEWQDQKTPVFYLRLFYITGKYITINNQEMSISDESWNPTGEWIAFTGLKTPGWKNELWITSSDNDQAQMILYDQPISDLDWSPEGILLAFSTEYYGYPSTISIFNIDTKEIQEIAEDNPYAYAPRWSPDGKSIGYITATDDVNNNGYSLNIYSLATNTTIQIIKDHVAGGASWRP